MSKSTVASLVRLREQIFHDRKQDVQRAIEFSQRHDDKMAAYHCGLADARNGLVKVLSAIINGASNGLSID